MNDHEGLDTSDTIPELPCKPRGRPLLLGSLDSKVQLILKKIRVNGGAINTRIAIAAARGIVMYYNPSLLVENGGHVNLTHNWAASILERMDFVKRKGSTAKSRESMEEFQVRKQAFLNEVAMTVNMEDIPAP